MNPRFLILLGLALNASVCATSKTLEDDVRIAMLRLEQSPNFTWRTTMEVRGSFAKLPTLTGKLERNGYIVASATWPDLTLSTVGYHGRYVFENGPGWSTWKEANPRIGGVRVPPLVIVPTTQLLALLEACPVLSMSRGAIEGTLDAVEMQRILFDMGKAEADMQVFHPEWSECSTDFQIWMTDGLVTKYAVHVEGIRTIRGHPMGPVEFTRTTEIFAVGTTTVEVPPAAKAELARLEKEQASVPSRVP